MKAEDPKFVQAVVQLVRLRDDRLSLCRLCVNIQPSSLNITDRCECLQVSHVQAARRQVIGVLDAVVDTALLRALVRVREFVFLVTLMVKCPFR